MLKLYYSAVADHLNHLRVRVQLDLGLEPETAVMLAADDLERLCVLRDEDSGPGLTRSQARVAQVMRAAARVISGDVNFRTNLFSVQGLIARVLSVSRQTVVRAREALMEVGVRFGGHAQRLQRGAWWNRCYDGTVFEVLPVGEVFVADHAKEERIQALRDADGVRPSFAQEMDDSFSPTFIVGHLSAALREALAPVLLAAFSICPGSFGALVDILTNIESMEAAGAQDEAAAVLDEQTPSVEDTEASRAVVEAIMAEAERPGDAAWLRWARLGLSVLRERYAQPGAWMAWQLSASPFDAPGIADAGAA